MANHHRNAYQPHYVKKTSDMKKSCAQKVVSDNDGITHISYNNQEGNHHTGVSFYMHTNTCSILVHWATPYFVLFVPCFPVNGM